MATNQTLATWEVAAGVVAQINTPIDATVWSESGFSCQRSYLPEHTDAQLATLQIDVIPVFRGRGMHGQDQAMPESKRVTRGSVRTTHRLQILFQLLVGADPNVFPGLLDGLGSFVSQVDDYWHAAHRVIGSLPSRTGNTNIDAVNSEITAYSPKDLKERGLFAAKIDQYLSVVEKW